MDAKPLLNIFLTLASPQFQVGRHFEYTIEYPINVAAINFEKGCAPRTILVNLPENGLTFEECLECLSELSQRFRELGIKVNPDMDIQYCCLLSDSNATLCDYILTYPMS